MRTLSLKLKEQIFTFIQTVTLPCFLYAQISFLIFLLLYTFIICTHFEIDIHPAEYVLHAWVLTLIFEEIRQLIYQEPVRIRKKIEFYFSDAWNVVDFISMTMFVIAAALRYVAYAKRDQNYIIAARIIFATDIAFFFFRLLQIFLVNRKMGPKIVMIREMVSKSNWTIICLKAFFTDTILFY